jgi:hypothetical protein
MDDAKTQDPSSSERSSEASPVDPTLKQSPPKSKGLFYLGICLFLGASMTAIAGTVYLVASQNSSSVSTLPSSETLNFLKQQPAGLLYGFQQDPGKSPKWWLLRIMQVEGSEATVVLNTPPDSSGKGLGKATGFLKLGPNSTVTISLKEQAASNGINLFIGSAPEQTLTIIGKLSRRGNKSYFTGNFIQRGEKINTETTWLIDTKAPPGFKQPT